MDIFFFKYKQKIKSNHNIISEKKTQKGKIKEHTFTGETCTHGIPVHESGQRIPASHWKPWEKCWSKPHISHAVYLRHGKNPFSCSVHILTFLFFSGPVRVSMFLLLFLFLLLFFSFFLLLPVCVCFGFVDECCSSWGWRLLRVVVVVLFCFVLFCFVKGCGEGGEGVWCLVHCLSSGKMWLVLVIISYDVFPLVSFYCFFIHYHRHYYVCYHFYCYFVVMLLVLLS